MRTQRHWLNHWWFRAIVLVALVIALTLAIRLHSASGDPSRAAGHAAVFAITTPAEWRS